MRNKAEYVKLKLIKERAYYNVEAVKCSWSCKRNSFGYTAWVYEV